MSFATDFIAYIHTHAPVFAGRFFVAALILVAGSIAGRILARGASNMLSRRQDTVTLAPVIGSLVKVMIIGAAAITALAHIGIDVSTVLAGAGVLGLAVGFGAQTLVKDLLSGFFLIFDGVLSVGDAVKMDQVEGVVESVGLRMTQVRSFTGRVWYVPNGSISVVGNSSRDWGRAVIEVGIGYQNDVGKALKLLNEIGTEFARERGPMVLEAPLAQGVLSLDDSSVKLRLVVKTIVAEQFNSEIELRRRVKETFEKNGIEIPYPTRVVHHRDLPQQPVKSL